MDIKGDVFLKKGREASVKRFHPWVFSGAIQTKQGKIENGDWVCVRDSTGSALGYGHFQPGTISVRLLSFSSVPGSDFYSVKIRAALSARKNLNIVNPRTNCFRLVHGEGDGLAGLIIDVYGSAAVVQAHSAGIHADRHLIGEALKEELEGDLRDIYYKGMATGDGKSESEYLQGTSTVPHEVIEHGNKFLINWESGQKTGFFIDQRENRRLLGSLSNDKTVLNTFCYTGGFSVYAMQGGARRVDSIDVSERAIELARKNIALNGYDAGTNPCVAADTFDFLKDKKDAYDIIVLDPPAFAKHKEARHQAMKGYQRLNAEAMRVIKSGGILFTFSCSQVVDRQLFFDTVVSSAIQSGREIQVLHTLSQPPDHPVSIYHPEGEYLKGLVLFVR